jgi:WD40 repeat protein
LWIGCGGGRQETKEGSDAKTTPNRAKAAETDDDQGKPAVNTGAGGATGLSFIPKVFLTGHKKTPYAVAFSPDGATLLSVSEDNTVKVWEFSTGKERRSFDIPKEEYAYEIAAFSPDAKSLAIGAQKNPKVWDTEAEKARYDLEGFGKSSIAFSADGTTIAFGSFSDVQLIDASTGKKRATFKDTNARPLAVAFSQDGKVLASGHDDNLVRLWDVATGKVKSKLPHPKMPGGMVFSPDGKVLMTVAYDSMLRYWDLESGKERKSVRLGEPVALVLSPDGKTLLAPASSTSLAAWDTETGKSLASDDPQSVPRTSQAKGAPAVPAFSRDGKLLAVGFTDGSIQVWEVTKRAE